jgi:phosphoribosylamine--glycine ligase
MTVAVIGAGAREHALAWKLLHSDRVQSLILVPGSEPALEQLQRQFASKHVARWSDGITGPEALRDLGEKLRADGVKFVVVGPDNALADGAVDILSAAGVPTFGPSRAASEIESSKTFSKRLMASAGVPTAEFYEATSVAAAEKILRDLDWKNKHWVIKADGLALGKGVEICETLESARTALQRLQAYSHTFVIEERLYGREVSWLAFCDGDTCSLLPPAQDYKTLGDDPLSPNTGGMGAICPVPIDDPDLAERVRTQVFLPVLNEMKRRGTPYKGVLYAGLMLGKDCRLHVLEFNARFGDPEAQAILPLVDVDLLDWCEACVTGRLRELPARVPMISKSAVYVCAAAAGYPGAAEKGARIDGVTTWTSAHHGFFAGVRKEAAGDYRVDGGRVLGALGLGANLREARAEAFAHLQEISFAGMQVRNGVGREWTE